MSIVQRNLTDLPVTSDLVRFSRVPGCRLGCGCVSRTNDIRSMEIWQDLPHSARAFYTLDTT
jgi:hypothetical protein